MAAIISNWWSLARKSHCKGWRLLTDHAVQREGGLRCVQRALLKRNLLAASVIARVYVSVHRHALGLRPHRSHTGPNGGICTCHQVARVLPRRQQQCRQQFRPAPVAGGNWSSPDRLKFSQGNSVQFGLRLRAVGAANILHAEVAH